MSGIKILEVGKTPSRKSLLLAGHSHVWALHTAHKNGCAEAPESVTTIHQSLQRTQEHLEAIAAHCEERFVVLVWEGNQHNRFLIERPPCFEVVPPASELQQTVRDVEHSSSTLIVPFEAAVALFLTTLDKLREIILGLTGASKIFVVGTPPPKPETYLRRALIKAEFASQLKQTGACAATARITPLVTRLALWQALQEAMTIVARECNASFVAIPPEVQAADGALLDEFCLGDGTHANSVYGARLWQKLASQLKPIMN
jgi:hypothetical protein